MGSAKQAMAFLTPEGIPVPSVTAEQMRFVNHIAIEEFRLSILQMMENAGRSVAQLVMAKLGDSPG